MLGACSINKVILMGRITADPELRQTANGVASCQFTVAITRAYAGQNGERQSDFINVVAWRQTAEFISRNFTKGKLILIEGELRTRTYDDKRYPEVKHYVTEVYADNVSFGETKSSTGSQSNRNAPVSNPTNQNGSYTPNASNAPQSANSANLSDFEEVLSDSDLPF